MCIGKAMSKLAFSGMYFTKMFKNKRIEVYEEF